jgi:DNA polymerase-3 subunit delta
MPIIKYNCLDEYLKSLAGLSDALPVPRFFLICGDAFLVRQSFNSLTDFLLKDVSREFALDLVEGTTASMGDIIEQTTTFSFLLSKKVIAVKNAPLFSAGGASADISYSAKDIDLLSGLVEKGIPEKHTLVMTCASLDKRKKIFKTIQTHGAVIDCTVSSGVRKADLDEQRGVLREIAKNLLAVSRKRMDAPAFNALVEQTGFNPDLFARNIEKLVAYTGANPGIGLDEIQAVVIRDKKDPIFSLTNALIERDAAKTLGVLSSLFKEGFHPLQILKSLENQVRKLLMIKSFIGSCSADKGAQNFKQMNFNGFTQQMMPIILAYDEMLKKTLTERDTFLSPANPSGKEKKKVFPADLLLAPNPKSPYPIFLAFQKSENFSLKELKNAIIALGDLDYQLKSSPIDAMVGIENFIITICRKGGGSHAAENQDRRHHL